MITLKMISNLNHCIVHKFFIVLINELYIGKIYTKFVSKNCAIKGEHIILYDYYDILLYF